MHLDIVKAFELISWFHSQLKNRLSLHRSKKILLLRLLITNVITRCK